MIFKFSRRPRPFVAKGPCWLIHIATWRLGRQVGGASTKGEEEGGGDCEIDREEVVCLQLRMDFDGPLDVLSICFAWQGLAFRGYWGGFVGFQDDFFQLMNRSGSCERIRPEHFE